MQAKGGKGKEALHQDVSLVTYLYTKIPTYSMGETSIGLRIVVYFLFLFSTTGHTFSFFPGVLTKWKELDKPFCMDKVPFV